jgi:3-phosphoshikimate 1-carboxyvinyltransferase
VAGQRVIEPARGPLDAEVRLPGSKSITNRALVCATLADGRSELHGALRADDTEAMASCIEALGAGVETDWAAARVDVVGTGGRLRPGPVTVDARMSGTTARFVAPLLALGEGEYTLTAHPQLAARPMGPTFEALRELGVEVVDGAEPGHLPVLVRAPGGIAGGTIRQPGHVSSQFLSGLLMAAPAMGRGLVVELTSELVSKPYVELTAAVMQHFGATVTRQNRGTTFAVAAQGYRAARFDIEPDATAASYFFAAAAVCGGHVRVAGLGRGSAQGDLRFLDVLARMGVDVELGHDAVDVRGTGELQGVTVDLADISDTAPTLAVVAACATTPTRVTGIGFIRRKETDRIAAVVAELRRCGVEAEEELDGFVVRPGPGGPTGAVVQTYDDHRMAMSFAVLGLRVPGITIDDPECVAKTFPSFFDVLDGLR